MARSRLDLTDLSVDSFEIAAPSLSAAPQGDGMANLGGGDWCCTGCDSGCGIYPTAGGCQSNGKTDFPYCDLTAYPCDSVDICAA
jgi:hypothetical protein